MFGEILHTGAGTFLSRALLCRISVTGVCPAVVASCCGRKMSLEVKDEDIETMFTRLVAHSVRWQELLQFSSRLPKNKSIPKIF